MAITSIVMKVYEYDEASNSIIVAFNSNESTVNIDDQPRMAYQPTMFEETDPEEVLKKIAQSGVSIAESQDKKVALSQDSGKVSAYKATVGQQFTYSVSDLYSVTPADPVIDGTNLTTGV
jgi:hypothetical protein